MNNSTSDISSHIRGFDIGSRIFLKKYLEAQQVWASKNVKNWHENVKKRHLLHSGRTENSVWWYKFTLVW
jgi:hypothetical protein